MPIYGDWVQPDDVQVALGQDGGIVSWHRDYAPSWATWTDAMGGSFGGSGDTFYGPADTKPDNYAGAAQYANPNQVGIYAFGMVRVDGVHTYPQIGPGPLPPSQSVEFEPGGAYYGAVTVKARLYLAESLTDPSAHPVKVLTPNSGVAAADELTGADFPTRSNWSTWNVRYDESLAPWPVPVTVEWDQASLEVAWAAVSGRMWDNPASDSSPVGIGFRYSSTQLLQWYTPPRYRIVYNPTGQWLSRQRHNPQGNAGGWPARQRQHGAASGAWASRQRQTGR